MKHRTAGRRGLWRRLFGRGPRPLYSEPGQPYPLGATVTDSGVNFAIFSRHARGLFLELYNEPDADRPWACLELDSVRNRTGDVWHVHVKGLKEGQLYGLRVDGPYDPQDTGHRFNVNKLLHDPCGRAFAGTFRFDHPSLFGFDQSSSEGDLSFSASDSAAHTVKTIVIDAAKFDWENDRRPRVPWSETVIYEAHVRGLTRHPSFKLGSSSAYLSVEQTIPHLKELGITTLELMPVHEFNADELTVVDPHDGTPLKNYWGYSTLGFFAPHREYADTADGLAASWQFKQMVKRLHDNGIEVTLDVVYNHTGEGNERGPTVCFRGLDNSVYYALAPQPRYYMNHSGCGNTLNCNHPVVKEMILASLRYWALEMHVDGFRFDLATILGRASEGQWLDNYSLLRDIAEDPILHRCKLIAESWDAGGLYKVGQLPGNWAEWNGRFRDDVRRFVRGEHGTVADLARRLSGSADMFAHKPNGASSINYITCHDGFTLRDLVCFANKHNARNGENGRDGCNDNYSNNWGVEGETDGSEIQALRKRAAKSLLSILCVSRGTPMLLAGDELWRTQHGNNNAYCQDNELSWIDWTPSETSAEMQRFVKLLLQLRRHHPALRRGYIVDPFNGPEQSDISWHGVEVNKADWAHHSQALAMRVAGTPPPGLAHNERPDDDYYVLLNGWSETLVFDLPDPPQGTLWHRIVDTSLATPNDIVDRDHAVPIAKRSYKLAAHAVAVLAAPAAKEPAVDQLVGDHQG